MAEGTPHFDAAGRARMVDVGDKPATRRVAVARGTVVLAPEAFSVVASGTAAKGDALGVARVAGIAAGKRTADLIPLCHALPLTSSQVRFRLEAPCVHVEAEVECTGPTGVEMEALTAVSVACLTLYDMAKAYGRGATLTDIRLVRKAGGRSGTWEREGEAAWDLASQH